MRALGLGRIFVVSRCFSFVGLAGKCWCSDQGGGATNRCKHLHFAQYHVAPLEFGAGHRPATYGEASTKTGKVLNPRTD